MERTGLGVIAQEDDSVGVLVELGGVGVFGEWIGESRESEVWRRWLECPWVRRYERGQCSTDEFARGMVDAWDLVLAPDEFLDHFRSWPLGLFDGAEELVGALRGRVRRACFSNTNELHWDHQLESFGLDGLFDDYFLSYRMQLVKPDREAFEHVVAALEAAPEEILFLDDNPINVDGARAVGIDAHCVMGVAEARRLLEERKIL